MDKSSGSKTKSTQDPVSSPSWRSGPERKLTEKLKREFRKTFQLFDTDGSEHIDVEDLEAVITSLGLDPKEFNNNTLIDNEAKNHKETISFSVLLAVVTQKLSDINPMTKMNEAFQLFADNMTGKISFMNLKQAAHQVGEDMSNEELDEMITEADMDGDELINKDEFCKFMTKAQLKEGGE